MLDDATLFHECFLARQFITNGALQRAETVQVLDFDAGAEFQDAQGSDGNIWLDAQQAFFQIAGVHAEITQNAAQCVGAVAYRLHGMQFRLGDDFEQGDSGTIQVHQRITLPTLDDVREFAGVFFHMYSPDAHALLPFGCFHHHPAVGGQRLLVLRDLISLGEVRVKVAFARKDTGVVDFAIERQGHAQGIVHRGAVNHRQHAGHPCADRADGHVGLLMGGIHHRAVAKHLGPRFQHGMDFKPDDRLIFGAHCNFAKGL